MDSTNINSEEYWLSVAEHIGKEIKQVVELTHFSHGRCERAVSFKYESGTCDIEMEWQSDGSSSKPVTTMTVCNETGYDSIRLGRWSQWLDTKYAGEDYGSLIVKYEKQINENK